MSPRLRTGWSVKIATRLHSYIPPRSTPSRPSRSSSTRRSCRVSSRCERPGCVLEPRPDLLARADSLSLYACSLSRSDGLDVSSSSRSASSSSSRLAPSSSRPCSASSSTSTGSRAGSSRRRRTALSRACGSSSPPSSTSPSASSSSSFCGGGSPASTPRPTVAYELCVASHYRAQATLRWSA